MCPWVSRVHPILPLLKGWPWCILLSWTLEIKHYFSSYPSSSLSSNMHERYPTVPKDYKFWSSFMILVYFHWGQQILFLLIFPIDAWRGYWKKCLPQDIPCYPQYPLWPYAHATLHLSFSNSFKNLARIFYWCTWPLISTYAHKWWHPLL